MIQLVDRFKDVYAAILVEHQFHDPIAVQFRSFMTQRFQEAGMRAADDVDKARREGVAPHLLVRSKDAPQPTISAPAYAKGYNEKGPLKSFRQTQAAAQQSTPVKSNAAPFKKMDISKGKSAAAPNQADNTLPTFDPAAQPQSVPTTVRGEEKEAGVAAGKIFDAGEISHIVTLQNSAAAHEYNTDSIRAYMDANNIPYTPTAKPKQLAATLIQHLKSK